MTEISRPWQGTNPGDSGPYSSDNWSQLQRYIIGQDGQNVESGIVEGSGVNPDPGLTVTQRGAGANMSVDISAGAALVNGTFYIDDATVNKAIAANASGNPRIDTIVLNKDWSAQTIRLAVVQGTPAGSPVPPTLVQNAGIQWQIPLADAAVANGAVSITNANITPRSIPANAPACVCLRGVFNNSGAVLQTGDVVVWDTTADRAIKTTTTADDPNAAGVWIGRTAIGGYGRMQIWGIGYVNSSAAVTRGNGLGTATVAKQATPFAVGVRPFMFATALQTTGGAGLALCFIRSIDINSLSYLMSKPLTQVRQSSGADYALTVATTWTTIDGTNLAATIVPYGTRVRVRAIFHCLSSASFDVSFDFLNSVSGLRSQNDNIGVIHANSIAANNLNPQFVAECIFTGLTPGTSYTFTLQYYKGSGALSLFRNGFPTYIVAEEM